MGTTSEFMSQQIKLNKSPKTVELSKKDQWNFKGKDGAIGQVTIGSKQNPVSVPGNFIITVPGQTKKIPSEITCPVKKV